MIIALPFGQRRGQNPRWQGRCASAFPNEVPHHRRGLFEVGCPDHMAVLPQRRVHAGAEQALVIHACRAQVAFDQEEYAPASCCMQPAQLVLPAPGLNGLCQIIGTLALGNPCVTLSVFANEVANGERLHNMWESSERLDEKTLSVIHGQGHHGPKQFLPTTERLLSWEPQWLHMLGPTGIPRSI